MRVVHSEHLTPERTVVPLCGRWRFLDEDWTAAESGVTCPDCRAALGAQAQAAAGTAASAAP